MEHLDLVQGSAAWKAHRATHWNASDAPAMMGLSPYKTRTELLHEIHTGVPADISAATQHLFDAGHSSEALARPLAETIVGEELYPVVGVLGKLSASFDGLTMADDIVFEHKSLNNELRALMVPGFTGDQLPMHYQVQMEQQCMVSGAKLVLFMASKWSADGTLIEERHCWYNSNPVLADKIAKGWAQFEADLAEYVPSVAVVAPVADVIEALPALVINVEGRVVSSNLAPFRDAALKFIAGIKTELVTDADFVNADNMVKFCSEGEARLKLVKEQALAQTSSIEELFRTIDTISEQMRQKRLALEKLVVSRKDTIKADAVRAGQAKLDAHVEKLNQRLGAAWIQRRIGGFTEAIKGKRTLSSMHDAINSTLAAAKISASELADRLDMNRKALVVDGEDYIYLFADFAQAADASAEVFSAVASRRIQLHKDQQKAKEDAAKAAADAAAAKTAADAAVVAQPAQPQGIGKADRPAPRTGEAAAPAVSGPPISTGTICERLGFTVTAQFIANLGFTSVERPKASKSGVFWAASDWPLICEAISQHVLMQR